MLETTHAAERWMPIPGYEGLYEVSDHGRVRSLGRTTPRIPGRLRKLHSEPDGRKRVTLVRSGQHGSHMVAVLMLSAFVGLRPRGAFACHNNGDASDDRLDNLRWDSPSSNLHDSVKHGKHGMANRTHCPRGHRLADPNLVPSAKRRGSRLCHACNIAFGRRKWAHLRGDEYDLQRESDLIYAQIVAPLFVPDE